MLMLNQVTLTRGSKILWQDLTLNVFAKQKVGVVGKNGCGKSSLFALIRKEMTPDAGECVLQNQVEISSLIQEIPDSDDSAIDYVLGGDSVYQYWQQALQSAMDNTDDEKILLCHEHLQNMDAFRKPAIAASILAGLGFSHAQQSQAVRAFSGGWRMRLGLARCLMKPAQLYLLDEPTNHLDLEAIMWLERWIKQLPAAVLLISHDRDFLDHTVEKILHIEHHQGKLYTGSYSDFENARANALLMQQTLYERQQNQIKHMMMFVNQFKAKASKAKQAQSRIKAIERMELVAQAQMDSPFRFEFFKTTPTGHPLLKCSDLAIGYENDALILKDLQWMVQPQDRIALLGPNGQGKSTLIKTLIGELSPILGEIFRANGLKIGYFAQHQVDSLDLNLSPLQIIADIDKQAKEQDIRQFLGGFHFQGDMVYESIQYFSGGEKARLALAKLIWQRPNLLLLDEPTNHLDLDMRGAIEIALQSYEGALILISHDRHLMQTCVNDFYLVFQQKLTPFEGDLDDYYDWLLNHQETPKTEIQVSSNRDYKQQKGLQNRIKKLEMQLEKALDALKNIEEQLGDGAIYDDSQKYKLQHLLNEQKHMKSQVDSYEQEWLSCMQQLEENQ